MVCGPAVGEQPLPCREEALGPENHDQHKCYAEYEVFILCDCREPQRDVADNRAAQNRADLVAGATEYNGRKEQDRRRYVKFLFVH